MSTLLSPISPPPAPRAAEAPTFANLLESLGGVPPERVRYKPMPGTATEQDVIDAHATDKRLCELIDGTLVEKTMGATESYLAAIIVTVLNNFVLPKKLGAVFGADGTIRLFPNQVRIPDVAFYSSERLPDGKVPPQPIPMLTPDLAIEVLSVSNTPREMERKVREYFEAGVRLVWLIDPKKRVTEVFTAIDQSTTRLEDETLDGGSVLPGFTVMLRQVFEQMIV